MKILITGAKGFIGKNLIVELKNQNYIDLFEFDKDTDPQLFETYCKEAEFIFHLAGVNRPEDPKEFMEGNFGLTSEIIDLLKKHKNTCPIMISSSIQAELDNPYGQSKKAGEDLMFAYEKETSAKVLVYRFPNVFGKWCRPNYNSAIATFCHNISRDLPIQINDLSVDLNLVYIDDVVHELIQALKGNEHKNNQFCEVPITYSEKLGFIVEIIKSFKSSRKDLSIPNMSDELTKKLYSTYLSYLPDNEFSYDLEMKIDHRGSFTEFIRLQEYGQISINISKSGITKGNHWHHTKNEKFCVVSGKGVIRFRKLDDDKMIEYFVSSEKLEVVDIPPGYTHNIENLGNHDMVTIMWANESLNPNQPDTYFEEV